MTTCWEEGMECVLSESDNASRKLKYTLELTKNQDTYILVNTHMANKIMKDALVSQQIPDLIFDKITPEFKVGGSRFDFCAEKDNKKYLIEIKNSSTKKDDFTIFPDTRSERALKHVKELTELQAQGYECILVFFIARNDTSKFRPAKEIMPDYFQACVDASKKGVKLLALEFSISPREITYSKSIPVVLKT